MTVIGADRPGLVQVVAARVADHGGNWLESRMCRLGGQFAGILRIEVDAARRQSLEEALRALDGEGLNVTIRSDPGEAAAGRKAAGGVHAVVEIVGQDRTGILRSVSGALAARGVNVEDLASERVSAPMGGGTLFRARAAVLVPPTVELAALRAELEKIGSDLIVDVKLETGLP